MKAPDKIYIPLTEGQDILVNDWSGVPMSQDSGDAVVENVEYIRKDALLEWAEEAYLTENTSTIRRICFKQLIGKIKSM